MAGSRTKFASILFRAFLLISFQYVGKLAIQYLDSGNTKELVMWLLGNLTVSDEPPRHGILEEGDNFTTVTRSEWNARRPKQEDYMGTPVEIVLIHHSVSGEAYTREQCQREARSIQRYHMDDKGWDDIAYSFLVCEDGSVYEARGWDRIGAHTLGWNNVAISVCFMGDYSKKLPSKEALIAGQLLIEAGVKLGKITEDYRLYGHCDMRPGFASPGQELYKLIQTWPHYDHSEPVKPAPKPYKGNLS